MPLSAGGVGAVAEPLRRVVADLLEPHQRGQHDAAPLDAVGVLQLPGEVVDRLLVERGLLLRQAAEGRAPRSCPADRRSRACRSSGGAGCTGGPGRAAGRKRRGRCVCEPLDEPANALARAEQAGVRGSRTATTDRPGDSRRACRSGRCGRAAVQLLDGAGLLRAGVLDRLGLVEDDDVPALRAAGHVTARRGAVGRDDDVGPSTTARRRETRAPAAGHLGRVGDGERCSAGAKRASSAFQFAISDAGTTSRLGVVRARLASCSSVEQAR